MGSSDEVVGVEVPLVLVLVLLLLLMAEEEEEEEEEAKGRGAVATSGRLWAELLKDCFSFPRSERRERIMDVISEGERSGEEQNVQGPMPSRVQIIFPQLRQLGAARRRGCRVALQGQAREGVGAGVREGLV